MEEDRGMLCVGKGGGKGYARYRDKIMRFIVWRLIKRFRVSLKNRKPKTLKLEENSIILKIRF